MRQAVADTSWATPQGWREMLAWLASDDGRLCARRDNHPMKLGVVGLLPPWEQIDAAAAGRVRAAGYPGVSIFFQKPLEADPAAVRRLKGALDDADLEAAQANGWYEVLVHPDEADAGRGHPRLAGADAHWPGAGREDRVCAAGITERDGGLVPTPGQLCACDRRPAGG